MEQLFSGLTKKLITHRCEDTFAVYYQINSDEQIELNELIGRRLKITASGVIQCASCGRGIKKTFQNGFCFPCHQGLAQADICQFKPERCHFALGTCRDSEWAQKQCMIPHTVYLARTSSVKVGVTRGYQEMTRWMDQGAVEALPIAWADSRLDAGNIEVKIAERMADKTHWMAMLKGKVVESDLVELREQAWKDIASLPNWQKRVEEPRQFNYPVTEYPVKVKSVNLDKIPQVEGVLTGIKGQYLMFDMQTVLNIRKYTGYELTWWVS